MSTLRLRHYEPVWIELKKKVAAKDKVPLRLAAHKALHPRLIKAVGKEKGMDLAFKFECLEHNKRAELVFISKGNILEIKLELTIGTDDI